MLTKKQFDEALAPAMSRLYAEAGIKPLPPHLATVLEQCWPELDTGSKGLCVCAPADAARLDALFALFGANLRTYESTPAVVGRAYDVFLMSLGPSVEAKLRGAATSLFEAWPADWRAYIEAVATENSAEAKRLYKQLQPLSPDCVFPKGVFVGNADGTTDDAHSNGGEPWPPPRRSKRKPRP